MDCTQVLVESDEEDCFPEENLRRQVASLKMNEEIFPIFIGENRIGRDPALCSVVITNMALSSQHAVIQGLECGMFLIYDLNSRNKTRLDKMVLVPNVRYQLKNGDTIRIANVTCTFHAERDIGMDPSSPTKDCASTQALELADSEEFAEVDSSDNEDTGKVVGNFSSAEGKNVNKDDVGVTKSDDIKGSVNAAEQTFKIPATNNAKNLIHSLGHLDVSKDSSCPIDSDDDIFDLLTQPHSDEGDTSEFTTQMSSSDFKTQGGRALKNSGELEKFDEPAGKTDIPGVRKSFFDSFPSKEESEPLKKDGVTNEEDIFNTETEGFPESPVKITPPKSGSTSTVIKSGSELDKDNITDEEDIFSAATERIPDKPKRFGDTERCSEYACPKDSDILHEGDITDEEDIFSAATERIPDKPKRFGDTERCSEYACPKDSDILHEGDITDEEDIFSAATERIPDKPKRFGDTERCSEYACPKDSDILHEGDITDEEDIFSAATEGFPVKYKKTCDQQMASEGSGIKIANTLNKQGTTDEDEENIFSAVTECFPANARKENTSKVCLRENVVKKWDAWDEFENIDEDDIFSAATEGFPVITKEITTDREDISCAATEGVKLKTKDVPETSAKHLCSDKQGISCSSVDKADKMKSGDGRKDKESIATSEHSCRGEDESAHSNASTSVTNVDVSKGGTSIKNLLEGEEKGKVKQSEVNTQETKGSSHEIESDGDETDLEDEGASSKEKPQNQHILRSVEKEENILQSDRLQTSSLGVHQNHAGLGSESEMEKEEDSLLKEPNTSIFVISDTEDEDEDGSHLNTSLECSPETRSVKSPVSKNDDDAVQGRFLCIAPDTLQVKDDLEIEPVEISFPCGSSYVKKESYLKESLIIKHSNTLITPIETNAGEPTVDEIESKAVDMVVDETLATARIIVTKKEKKSTCGEASEQVKGGENVSLPSNVVKPTDESLKYEMNFNVEFSKKNDDSGEEKTKRMGAQVDLTSKTTNKKSLDEVGDKTLVLIAECKKSDLRPETNTYQTPAAGKGMEDDEGEDMSSFLTEAPPEFETSKVGVEKLNGEGEDSGEIETKSALTSIAIQTPLTDRGKDVEEEDMTSFLTQAPPEFKTPTSSIQKINPEEDDLSELKTQPAPKCEHGDRDDEEEDMSSFLTVAPPEFKTPTANVQKVITEEDDISELETQLAPTGECKGEDHEEEDMSSFLTVAPPEFKTPTATVQKFITEEDDISELETQLAPTGECKGEDHEEEDMSSFLTVAPPEFKTPRATTQEINTEEDDISDLLTQPAPTCDRKDKEGEKEDMSSFLTPAPPVFKTPTATVQEINTEEDDISDLLTQPAPTCEHEDKGGEEEDMSSFLTPAPPVFKTPTATVQEINTEEDDISDLLTQPAPTCEHEDKGGEEEDMSSFLTPAPPEFKSPTATAQEVSTEEDDLSELETQPAPNCEHGDKDDEEDDMSSFLTVAPPEFKTPTATVQKVSTEEDDISELETQPAPTSDFISHDLKDKGQESMKEGDTCGTKSSNVLPLILSMDQIKKECNESEEEDLSLYNTQRAPTSEIYYEVSSKQKKGSLSMENHCEQAVSEMNTRSRKTSSADQIIKRGISLRGKIKVHQHEGYPHKKVFSPKADRKKSDVISDMKTQIEEEESDNDFSIDLPDTPDLINTIEESKRKFSTSNASCRKLFDTEKSKKFTSTVKIESMTEKLIEERSMSMSYTNNSEANSKKLTRKESKTRKKEYRGENTVCPTKELDSVAEPEPTKLKDKNLEKNVETAPHESKQRHVSQTVEEIKKPKLKTKSPAGKVMVTSTPIPTCVSLPKQDQSASVSLDILNEKYRKPLNDRGRKNMGDLKGKLGFTVSKFKEPDISEVSKDAPLRSCTVELQDISLIRVGHESQNLGFKQISRSESQIPAEANTDINETEEHSLGTRRRRNKRLPERYRDSACPLPSEVASSNTVSKKMCKRPNKNELNEGAPIKSVTQMPPTESLKSALKSDEVSKRMSGKDEVELSPVMFYGRRQSTLKGSVDMGKGTDSSDDTSIKGKPHGDISETLSEISVSSLETHTKVSVDTVRYPERKRKPKKQVCLDSVPVKPKRSKSDPEAVEPIPAMMRMTRGRKNATGSDTLSDSCTHSSKEGVYSSLDSTSSISKNRESDLQKNLRSNKRLKLSHEECLTEKMVIGNRHKNKESSSHSRERNKKGPNPPRDTLNPAAFVSDDKTKLVDSTVVGSRKYSTRARGEESLPKPGIQEGGMSGEVSGVLRKGRRKKESIVIEREQCQHVTTRSKAENISKSEQNRSENVGTDHREEVKRVGRRREKVLVPEKSLVSTTKNDNFEAHQQTNSRERNVVRRETRKRGGVESISSVELMKNSSDPSLTDVPKRSKVSKTKDIKDGSVASGQGRKRNKSSPVVMKITEEEQGSEGRVNPLETSKRVPPLRISRSRVVSENKKTSSAEFMCSPIYNMSIVACPAGEVRSSKFRKQKGDVVCVLFTGLSDPKLNQIVERLGGHVVETAQECTVLVTDRLRRTYKLLCAVARGIPIATVTWLMDSSCSGRFLDPAGFLVNDQVTEKRFDFTLKSSLEKAKAKPLFSGYSFTSTPSVKPPPEEVKGIVICAGGEYVSDVKSLEGKMPLLFYVVSCAEDSSKWDEYSGISVKRKSRSCASKGKVVSLEGASRAKLVGVEGLLVSILRQKLNLDNKEFSLC